MEKIELIWILNEAGKKVITSKGIDTKIEINETNKEIKNTKAFFRELTYRHFFKGLCNKIVLVDNVTLQIPDVVAILNDLVELYNNEIMTLSEEAVDDTRVV